MSFPLLTDKQILEVFRKHLQGNTIKLTRDSGPYEITELTYQAAALVQGIESATRAPLLAEIERLTAELAASREDAERWQYVRDNTDISLDSYVWVTTTLGRRVHITSPCRGTEAERAIDAARGEKAQADTLRERMRSGVWQKSASGVGRCMAPERLR